MRSRSNASRAAGLARLSERNRAALTMLHAAAQAISDDDPDYAEACMAAAARQLRASLPFSSGIASVVRVARLALMRSIAASPSLNAIRER